MMRILNNVNERYKYLVKNIGLFAISNFASKIMLFFLIPVYSSVLTTEEYGSYDLVTTTIELFIPFFTLNILDSVMRYSMDQETNNGEVFTVGLKFFLVGILWVLLFLLLNYYFKIIPIIVPFSFLFFITYVLTSAQGIISSMARGLGKVANISIANLMGTIVMILGNIFFLLISKWGLTGYFFANILSCFIQCLFLLLSDKMWKYLHNPFLLSDSGKITQCKMLRYSKPLIANSVGWWINSVSDRYIITWFCGVTVNGVYSISYKIPSILNFFQTIFAQAWTLSAVKEYDNVDKDGFFSKTYATYNCGMVIICSLIIAVDRILAKILYAKDFYEAWRYVPFLTIAIVFGSLSGFIGGIFSAVKKSDIFAKSTVIGAISNLILNVLLVRWVGVIGAAVATTVAYCIVWILRYCYMKKYINIKIAIIRDIISYAVLIVQTIVILTIDEGLKMYMIQVCLVAFLIILYKKDIGKVIGNLDKRKR